MGKLAWLQEQVDAVLAGGTIDRQTALELARFPEPEALFAAADTIRCHRQGHRFHACSIINARSGNCSEDCRFCAQASRHTTGAPSYPFIAMDKALDMAREVARFPVSRLSLVTSGRQVSGATLERVGKLATTLGRVTRLSLCASLGFLDRDRASRLLAAGISRYHCNLESSKAFFPAICSTHTWEEKVHTLELARDAGLSLCSGGIIGLGETMADRIDLALALRKLRIRSVPINIHTPIKGTPLAGMVVLPLNEVLTTIALFRFILPGAVIRMAGGRQLLGASQYRCFQAGANGAIVGNYLTTVGPSMEEDFQALAGLGFTCTPSPEASHAP